MQFPRFKVSLDQIPMHVLSALLAVFLFYTVISAANLLEIPFYLGYKRFIIDITILTPAVDRFLWVSSVAVFSTLVLARRVKGGLGGLRRVLVLLYVSVVIALGCALAFGFDVVGTVFLIVSGLAFFFLLLFLVMGVGVLLLLRFRFGVFFILFCLVC